MTRLILDHLRRWSWVLALAAVLCFGLGWQMCGSGANSSAFFVLMLSMWMGATLLGLDLKHGIVRTSLTLPLTARQIGRSWWFATVGIPAVAIAALLCSGAIMWSSFHPGKALPVRELAAASLFSLLWLGNTFTSIYGMTNEIFGTGRERMRLAGIALLSMVMLFGSMLLAQQLFHNAVIFALFLAIGTFLTAASWFRAERFVLGRAGFRFSQGPARVGSVEAHVPVGRGGISFLIGTTFTRGFLWLAAMVTLMTLLSLRRPPGVSFNFGLMMLTQMGSVMSLWFILLSHVMTALRELRLWRTLPISATRLAVVIVGLAILPLVAVGVMSAGIAYLAWGNEAAITALKSYLYVLAPAALSMCFATWQGTGRMVCMLLFLLVTGYGMIRPMAEASRFSRGIPPGLMAGVAAGTVLLGVLLTRHVLTRSSRAYRGQTARMVTFQG